MMIKKIIPMTMLCLIFIGSGHAETQDTLRNKETQHFLKSLIGFTKSEFTMFGMANALTISYSGGPKHDFNDKSDSKDITGSHPAMIETDFMWYDDKNFMRNDTIALREAYKRGAVTGYCYHLRGRLSKAFYVKQNGKFTADSALVKNILASAVRDSNISLDWYLDILDKNVIPVFKKLGFPIIYRPFHEMTGDWFWWGTETCTPSEYIQIWKLTIDYLRNAGVKNILYAWAQDKSADFKFYPGDDYVDIIGYDGYDIGTVDYHSTTTYVTNISKLSDYALSHNKAFAITETGYGKFPGKHPDFWFDHVLKPMKKNAKAKYTAWVMTWYNADWSNDKTGTSWIPYTGIETKTDGQLAIDEFMEFYNDPRTIFLDEVPSLYYSEDNSAFILPKKLNLMAGDSLKLMGGSKNNWFNESNTWTSSDPNVAVVNNSGRVKALKEGKIYIIIETPSKLKDSCFLEIKPLPVNAKTLENEEVRIYPNPSNGENIQFSFGSIAGIKKIKIFNVDGKQLLSIATENNIFSLSERNLESGLYIAIIQNGNQQINKRFLVK